MKKRTSKQQLLREENNYLIILGIGLSVVMFLLPGIWIIYLASTRQSQFGTNAMWMTMGILMSFIGCLVIGLTISQIHDNNKSSKQSL